MAVTELAQGLEMLIQLLKQDIADGERVRPLEHGTLELVGDFLLALCRGY